MVGLEDGMWVAAVFVSVGAGVEVASVYWLI